MHDLQKNEINFDVDLKSIEKDTEPTKVHFDGISPYSLEKHNENKDQFILEGI